MNRDQPDRREAERTKCRSNCVLRKWPWRISLASEKWCEETAVRSATEDKPLPPRLPSEALAYISVAGLRTLQAQPYSPDFPVPYGTSVILGFRTCSPLRGSSGFSPDSLLMPLAEQPWRKPLYLGFLSTASPLDVDILLKERVARVLSSLSLASETPPLMRRSLSSNWS